MPEIPFRWRRGVADRTFSERIVVAVSVGDSLRDICGKLAARFNSTPELAWQTPSEFWRDVEDRSPAIVSKDNEDGIERHLLHHQNETHFCLFTFPEKKGGFGAGAAGATAAAGGSIIGAAAAPAVAVAGVQAVGFGTGGIVAGSTAAGIMSAEAIAGGGMVAAGGTTATLQAIGATGSIAALGAGGVAAVVCAGAVAAAAVIGLGVWGGFKIAERIRRQKQQQNKMNQAIKWNKMTSDDECPYCPSRPSFPRQSA